jgi:hypothetical protein
LNSFPSVFGKTDASSEDPIFVSFKQTLFLETWKFVLQEVEDLLSSENPCIEAMLDGYSEPVKLVPVICMFPLDHPEAQDLVSQKSSNRTDRPCRVCTIKSGRLNVLADGLSARPIDPGQNLQQWIGKFLSPGTTKERRIFNEARVFLRNTKIMEFCREDDKLRNVFSLRHVPLCSTFSSESLLLTNEQGIWGATPPCMLHTFLSNGLVKRLLDATMSLIKESRGAFTSNRGGNARIQGFDLRWKYIPWFSKQRNYLRKFNSGISNLSFLTGEDYKHILMQLRVVLGSDNSFFMDIESFRNVIDAIDILHELVEMLWTQDSWTDEKIAKLHKLILE